MIWRRFSKQHWACGGTPWLQKMRRPKCLNYTQNRKSMKYQILLKACLASMTMFSMKSPLQTYMWTSPLSLLPKNATITHCVPWESERIVWTHLMNWDTNHSLENVRNYWSIFLPTGNWQRKTWKTNEIIGLSACWKISLVCQSILRVG